MKTRKQIIERALRILGVLAYDDALTAEQEQEAGCVLDSVFAKMNADIPGVSFAPVTDVPEEAFVPLANLLAAHMAPDYGVAAPVSRARAWLDVRAVYVKDDRRHHGRPRERRYS